jgi:hypothetical protein
VALCVLLPRISIDLSDLIKNKDDDLWYRKCLACEYITDPFKSNRKTKKLALFHSVSLTSNVDV